MNNEERTYQVLATIDNATGTINLPVAKVTEEQIPVYKEIVKANMEIGDTVTFRVI